MPRRFGFDLGNSRLKVWRLPDQRPVDADLAAWWKARPEWSGPSTAFAALLDDIVASEGLDGEAHLVSVNPPLARALEDRLAELGMTINRWTTASIAITHPYADASRLGADRALAALAAHHLVPGRWRLVIDAGSAVTFDLVDAEGGFRGGAIAPGRPLLAAALGRGAQLPALSGSSDRSDYPGLDTETACRLGIDAAFRGAAVELCRDALNAGRRLGGGELAIVITGGDGALLADQFGAGACRLEPQLLGMGLGLLACGAGR